MSRFQKSCAPFVRLFGVRRSFPVAELLAGAFFRPVWWKAMSPRMATRHVWRRAPLGGRVAARGQFDGRRVRRPPLHFEFAFCPGPFHCSLTVPCSPYASLGFSPAAMKISSLRLAAGGCLRARGWRLAVARGRAVGRSLADPSLAFRALNRSWRALLLPLR